MATFGLMRDNAIDDRPVILPSSNSPHAFQRSDFHRFCDLCLGRRGNVIHDWQYIQQASMQRSLNIARARAR